MVKVAALAPAARAARTTRRTAADEVEARDAAIDDVSL
jgi:hypothetical protein